MTDGPDETIVEEEKVQLHVRCPYCMAPVVNMAGAMPPEEAKALDEKGFMMVSCLSPYCGAQPQWTVRKEEHNPIVLTPTEIVARFTDEYPIEASDPDILAAARKMVAVVADAAVRRTFQALGLLS